MNVPPKMAAEHALLQQAVTLSMMKLSLDNQKSIANLLDRAVQSVPQGARGGHVNISA